MFLCSTVIVFTVFMPLTTTILYVFFLMFFSVCIECTVYIEYDTQSVLLYYTPPMSFSLWFTLLSLCILLCHFLPYFYLNSVLLLLLLSLFCLFVSVHTYNIDCVYAMFIVPLLSITSHASMVYKVYSQHHQYDSSHKQDRHTNHT